MSEAEKTENKSEGEGNVGSDKSPKEDGPKDDTQRKDDKGKDEVVFKYMYTKGGRGNQDGSRREEDRRGDRRDDRGRSDRQDSRFKDEIETKKYTPPGGSRASHRSGGRDSRFSDDVEGRGSRDIPRRNDRKDDIETMEYSPGGRDENRRSPRGGRDDRKSMMLEHLNTVQEVVEEGTIETETTKNLMLGHSSIIQEEVVVQEEMMGS